MTLNKLTGALLMAVASSTAIAADINFSGYGTIRGGMAFDEDAQTTNFGYDETLDFKNESKFAIQAITQLNKKWSATIVMHADGAEDFDIEARWAYLNYQYTPETTVTLGRFALPYFRHSDTQDIGYSHNYSRMPTSIYDGQEFDLIEGIRITHATYIGDADLTLKASYGSFDGSADTSLGDVDTEITNIIQFSAEYSYEWFSFYAGVLSADVTLDINDQIDQQLMFTLPGYVVSNNTVYNPTNAAVYDMKEIYVEEDSTVYMTAGFTAEHENWLFNIEYAAYDVDDTFFEEKKAFYASISYNFEQLTVSIVHEDASYSFDYDHANSADPYVNGFAQAVTNAFFKPSEYDAQGIHLRYDAMPGVAYKFEYTHSSGDFSGDSSGIATFGIDFVF
ncbi:porin [Thalassotalea sp. M1531]|uniref:Porin n=1 Tax=Thalassotalea algicola TaxID=2716224 RepID=A0A7Y0Q7W0_9GAMM|nr:porin [Thalassotalea algicola]NMP31430.1 porin [Thalassotalea algicola]